VKKAHHRRGEIQRSHLARPIALGTRTTPAHAFADQEGDLRVRYFRVRQRRRLNATRGNLKSVSRIPLRDGAICVSHGRSVSVFFGPRATLDVTGRWLNSSPMMCFMISMDPPAIFTMRRPQRHALSVFPHITQPPNSCRHSSAPGNANWKATLAMPASTSSN